MDLAPSSLLVVDSFFSKAKSLRRHFDSCFADPRRAGSERFVWDYWHVPNQYTLLRTPAYHFFPKPMYEQFHRHLVAWGRKNLGCHDISPPWLSCYVDGCEQQLHGDLPHGPWAFVFSLTNWNTRQFTGGETLMMNDPILDFWRQFETGRGMEHGEIFQEIPSNFNRLVVFDPRIPHGVKRVQGVHDVRQGRLVIHGWFVRPKPVIEGPLPTRALQSAIDGVSETLNGLFTQGISVSGVVSLKFQVTPTGSVRGLRILTNTLRSGNPQDSFLVLEAIAEYLVARKFSKSRAASVVTLPFIFEQS